MTASSLCRSMWFLPLATSCLVAAVHASSGLETTTNKNGKLISFRLIPGDSAEARLRRQRRLAHTKRITEEESEPQDPKENPLDVFSDALYEGYGVHYVDIWVGSPIAQRVTTIVDTGSSVTGFPCTGCESCGGSTDEDGNEQYHTDKLFRQEDSITFEIISSKDQCILGSWADDAKSCRTSRHYSEGSSWDAFEAVDLVYTGGSHEYVDSKRMEEASFRLHFGCQDSVTGLFETQLADGIMGLYISEASFWYQMYKEKKIEQQSFSLCFSEPGRVDRKGTPAGAMVLGGTDTRLHKTPMVYAKQSNADGKYSLHLEKVYLLEPGTGETTEVHPQIEQYHKVQIFEEDLNNRGPIILDSGTTATYLTKQLENHFVQVFNDMVPEDVMVLDPEVAIYNLTLAQVKQLPTVVLQMKGWNPDGKEAGEVPSITKLPGIVGADLDPQHAGRSIVLAIPPSSYLTRSVVDNGENDVTDPDQGFRHMFSLFFTKKSGSGGVLGGNFMRGYDILFDIDNSRIGFAESDCEYSALVDAEESG